MLDQIQVRAGIPLLALPVLGSAALAQSHTPARSLCPNSSPLRDDQRLAIGGDPTYWITIPNDKPGKAGSPTGKVEERSRSYEETTQAYCGPCRAIITPYLPAQPITGKLNVTVVTGRSDAAHCSRGL